MSSNVVATATFTGTIRKMDTLNTWKETPCINAYIPQDRGKDDAKKTSWHKLTFWNSKAEFAARNFRNGTIITARCSIITKEDGKVTFNVIEVTPLANWGTPK